MAGHDSPPLHSGHAGGQRGLDNATRSPLFQGRFGRMFRIPSASWGTGEIEKLDELAQAIVADPDPIKDGADAEESAIPALYTYFGQFIDHDITFDPVSLLTKRSDPDALVDFRTPALDLDNIYGRGPADQPYLFDGKKFRLGEVLTGEGVPNAHDLPRLGGRAVIGDPRNDENVIVSQFQGLMHRFHNRMVDENPDADFGEIQDRVRFHYQYVVYRDYLATIVAPSVLDGLRAKSGRFAESELRFFHWRNSPFMPVEFSVAAFRFGHSMVRPGYRLNDDDDMLLPIFRSRKVGPSLAGFGAVGPGRAIDWARFVDIELRDYGPEIVGPAAPDAVEAGKRRLQLAYRIDASLVDPLGHLPRKVAPDKPASLAFRNLKRGLMLGVPSGQDVADAMDVAPLAPDELFVGKAAAGELRTPLTEIAGGVFATRTPLWLYVLAEAAAHAADVAAPVAGPERKISTPRLGPVGGGIVAEVLLGLLFGDPTSVLSLAPGFQPVTGPDFGLPELVRYALGHGPALS